MQHVCMQVGATCPKTMRLLSRSRKGAQKVFTTLIPTTPLYYLVAFFIMYMYVANYMDLISYRLSLVIILGSSRPLE